MKKWLPNDEIVRVASSLCEKDLPVNLKILWELLQYPSTKLSSLFENKNENATTSLSYGVLLESEEFLPSNLFICRIRLTKLGQVVINEHNLLCV